MKMMRKYMICAILVLTVSILHQTTAISPSESKSVSSIIIDAIKNQIKKLINLVESIVNKAIEELVAIEHKIGEITSGAIKSAIAAINFVIDGAIDSIRQIAEDAIDAGLNITECYVRSLDELNIIRRKLLAEEVVCATSQLDQFNEIINAAVKNFTDDLSMILELPKRLKDCLTSLNLIPCVSELVTDVTQLQQDIPKQILGTMMDITEYMTGFENRVHKCQFDELREAIDASRKVIDGVRNCARPEENTAKVRR